MKEPPRYVLYARGHREPDVHSRIYVPIYNDPALAKAWLDFFTGNELFTREGNTLLLESGIKINSDQLDTILGCNQLAELPERDERRIMRFKYGTWDEPRNKLATPDVKRSPAVARERRPERPTGYVTITDLCNASGILPMHARASLRASGRVKPDYGWAFDPKDVPAIKTIIGVK